MGTLCGYIYVYIYTYLFMLCVSCSSLCLCVNSVYISLLSPETTALLSLLQGSSLTPLSPPGLSVTIPDQLLHTCRLRPVIFKGQMTNCISDL